MVNAANARDEDNGFATDNAISALGKMILYQPEALAANRTAAVGMFLNYLPVTVDEEEGIKVHGCLCSLLERGEPALLEQVCLVLFADAMQKLNHRASRRMRKGTC